MRCQNCRDKFDVSYFLQKFCEVHEDCIKASNEYKNNKYRQNSEVKKKPTSIARVSKKRQIEELKYKVLRIEFLGKKENRICPIFRTETTDIHHKKGRVGSLYLDTKYWVALSREGHKLVEENPDWAKENGYSLNRLSNE